MPGLGLTLTVADFAHVTGYPRAGFVAPGRPLSRRLRDQLERA